MAQGLRVAARAAAPWIAVAAAAIGVLTFRVVWSSRAELIAGRAALAAGDTEEAILRLRRAAHWYAPGNPFVVEALSELRRIGRRAEMEGEDEVALLAYRSIRASCLGTRSFYTPHGDRLEEANRRIAALMAQQPPPPMDRGKTIAQIREEHYALLASPEEPSPFWSALACLSFLAWVGGAFGFVGRGLDAELHLRRRPALAWGAIVVAGLAVWVASLLLA